jgi:ELWxxDGT repeat protein
VANGTLFFRVTDTSGSQLWKSDGTRGGTALVRAIDPGVDTIGMPFMASIGGAVYFASRDGAHGGELWKSDGTAAGTVLVQDINPGPAGSSPEDLVAADGTLYFSADDGTHGRQLWSFSPPAAPVSLPAQLAAIKVQEGQKFSGLVATFADPGSTGGAAAYRATITWGDGHTSAGTVTAGARGSYAVSGSNTYASAGSYAVSVTISRAGATAAASGTASVTAAEFWAVRLFQRVSVGQTQTLVLGTLASTNPLASAGEFTVKINWGDGQTSNGTLTPGPGSTSALKLFAIGGTHKYTATGFYTLTITLTEVGGLTVTINPLIAVDA